MTVTWISLELVSSTRVINALLDAFDANPTFKSKFLALKLSATEMSISISAKSLKKQVEVSKDVEAQIFAVSKDYPLAVIILNSMDFPTTAEAAEDFDSNVYGDSRVLLGGEFLATMKRTVTGSGKFNIDSHEHHFDKEGKPDLICATSHYGYVFEIKHRARGGKIGRIILSREFDGAEKWNDYNGFDKLLNVTPFAHESDIIDKKLLDFADSEAEMLLLETKWKANVGEMWLYPSVDGLNPIVLAAIAKYMPETVDRSWQQMVEDKSISAKVSDFMETVGKIEYRGILKEISVKLAGK